MIVQAPAENLRPDEGPGSTQSLGWPVILLAIALIGLCVPVFVDIQPLWHNERGGHCIFILPLCLALAWLRRDLLKGITWKPDPRGLWLLGLGLGMELFSFLFKMAFIEGYSMVPILAGFVLLCFGGSMLSALSFPIAMMIFIVPFPNAVISPISQWISVKSADGSVGAMHILGYPIAQDGNIIHLHGGVEVVVADVCSGFNKLSILFIMSLVYGDMFPISAWRRFALTACALPIAMVSNVMRITIILLVSNYGGVRGLHAIHDWAEIIVVVIAFFLFLGLGTLLGCKRPRFSV